jgi:hypothetical protein
MRVRHWTSSRSLQYVQAKPAQRFVDLPRENRVTIVDYIAKTRLVVHELAKLLSRPLRGRMIGHIDMQDATRTDLDRDQLSFSQIESALAMATKSTGKPN